MTPRGLSRLLMVSFVGLVGCFSSSTPNPPPQETGPGPADVYLQYGHRLTTARSLEEIVPYLSSENRARIEGASPEERRSLLRSLQVNAPEDVRVRSIQDVGEGGAALEVEGTKETPDGRSAPARATVLMVQELGYWRISRENWLTLPR